MECTSCFVSFLFLVLFRFYFYYYPSDEFDGASFFPELDGSFQGLPNLHEFNVKGQEQRGSDLDLSLNSESNLATTTYSSCTPTPRKPAFRSVISSRSNSKNHTEAAAVTHRVRVTKALMTQDNSKSSPTFKTLSCTPTSLLVHPQP